MSSRCENRCLNSLLCRLAQGAIKNANAATNNAKGKANLKTEGNTDSKLWPLANQITISESRKARVRDIKIAKKSVNTSTTDKKLIAENAISGITLAVSTAPPAALPSKRISVVVTIMVNKVVNTMPARLAKSLRRVFLKIMNKAQSGVLPRQKWPKRHGCSHIMTQALPS
jgi:translation elongation factor EF-G